MNSSSQFQNIENCLRMGVVLTPILVLITRYYED
ncbi:hypothetical protein TUMEXPCC7403_25635 [Tumidithrix helvetica PCC 7403]